MNLFNMKMPYLVRYLICSAQNPVPDLKNIKEMYCERDKVDQDFVIQLKSSIATFRKLLWIYEL